MKTLKYFGCKITNYQTNRTNGIIRKHFERKITKEVQISLLNIFSKHRLLYGRETWALRAQDRKRLETAQMRFLRSVEGVTLRDKKKQDTKGYINSEELNQWYKRLPEKLATSNGEHGYRLTTPASILLAINWET